MKVIYTNHIANKETPSLFFCSHVPNTKEVYQRRMHMHKDFSEIIMVVSGQGVYQIDGKEYYVKVGDMIVVNSFVAHEENLQSNHDDGVETYCCGIKMPKMDNGHVARLIPDNASPIFSLEYYAKIVTHYFSLIFLLLEDNKDDYAQRVLEELLSFLEKVIFSNIELYSERNNDILMYRVKGYIEQNFYEEISVDFLSNMVNTSTYYLCHKFKEKFNISPINYLIKCRIGEAQTLLQNTDKSISEICFLVGFNNVSHFQTTFKKLTQMTPRNYRLDYYKSNDKG